jgi:hypothetical protein
MQTGSLSELTYARQIGVNVQLRNTANDGFTIATVPDEAIQL